MQPSLCDFKGLRPWGLPGGSSDQLASLGIVVIELRVQIVAKTKS